MTVNLNLVQVLAKLLKQVQMEVLKYCVTNNRYSSNQYT